MALRKDLEVARKKLRAAGRAHGDAERPLRGRTKAEGKRIAAEAAEARARAARVDSQATELAKAKAELDARARAVGSRETAPTKKVGELEARQARIERIRRGLTQIRT